MADSPTPTIDLALEFNKQIAKIPGNAAAQTVTKLEVNLGEVALALATAWAEDIRENLLAGKKPDGSGPMPVRKTPGMTGRRGEGTSVAASISARWSKVRNRLVIAADEADPGALRRILRGIPFRPPLSSPRISAVKGDAALIATLTGNARRKRSNGMYSAKRLAMWRKWQASIKAKAK